VRRAGVLLLLLLAAAAPPKAPPAPPAAKPEDVAEQLAMLEFDANPLWAVPERVALSRWVGPLRLFAFGRPEDRADARVALRALARPTGLPLRLVVEKEVARLPPNVFLVVDENPQGAFRGPLRGMLRNAFLDDEVAVTRFIAGVVDATPCWTLPVWTDPSRLVLKAAVIGVDARLPRAETRACILHGLGATLGLLGPGAFLPGSAFAPGTAARLSRDDDRMLRVLYGRALQPGMSRGETVAAATRALAPPARKPAVKTASKP
jgi:hypothetical protein